ncbi:MAG: type II toxin-antitoxin system death-on-curing family toxin [Saprospiraceae bacterium]
MKLLFKRSIIEINRRTIEEHGGNFIPPFNFLHEGVLDYAIEAVNKSLFGEPMYPSFSDNAAFYMFQIIAGHVFSDGNKRTGLEAAFSFLQLNGYDLEEELIRVEVSSGLFVPTQGEGTEEILENFTLEMASGTISLDEAKLWFKENISPLQSTT